ncbi:MAG: type II toxin-antitoxin system Phd/YefM family antitoxin [Clostridia bacterium]|nr:type II toxin-antitoxin system Phd/YefM family antitoxin [Clostridia bacterium]
MLSVVSAVNRTVPISQFNRGLAGQIFSDVKKTGPKVVMKNNEAEVVILPPQEYVELMDILNDYELLSLALERMEHFDSSTLISEEEMDRELGITQEEYDSVGEVEFE